MTASNFFDNLRNARTRVLAHVSTLPDEKKTLIKIWKNHCRDECPLKLQRGESPKLARLITGGFSGVNSPAEFLIRRYYLFLAKSRRWIRRSSRPHERTSERANASDRTWRSHFNTVFSSRPRYRWPASLRITRRISRPHARAACRCAFVSLLLAHCPSAARMQRGGHRETHDFTACPRPEALHALVERAHGRASANPWRCVQT